MNGDIRADSLTELQTDSRPEFRLEFLEVTLERGSPVGEFLDRERPLVRFFSVTFETKCINAHSLLHAANPYFMDTYGLHYALMFKSFLSERSHI